MRVIDDGTGRPPFHVNGKGMGLRIMSYRADCIGAKFSIRRREPRRDGRDLLPSRGPGDDLVMTKSKIFIVDDHPLVREWLTTLIDQTADLRGL